MKNLLTIFLTLHASLFTLHVSEAQIIHVPADQPTIQAGIAAGDPDTTGLFLPPGDLLGNIRVWDGNDDGEAIIDMGAYEFGAEPVGVEERSAVGGQRSSVLVYPNPTAGMVDFRFSMVDGRRSMVNGQWVSLKIYDVHGRVVATVLEGRWYGDKVIRWDATGLPSGIYILNAVAGHEYFTRKIILQH